MYILYCQDKFQTKFLLFLKICNICKKNYSWGRVMSVDRTGYYSRHAAKTYPSLTRMSSRKSGSLRLLYVLLETMQNSGFIVEYATGKKPHKSLTQTITSHTTHPQRRRVDMYEWSHTVGRHAKNDADGIANGGFCQRRKLWISVGKEELDEVFDRWRTAFHRSRTRVGHSARLRYPVDVPRCTVKRSHI